MKAFVALLSALLVAACSTTSAPTSEPASAPTTDCRPTVARMTLPEQFFNFVVAGSSSPDVTREALRRSGNFYANDAVWVLLPESGEARVGGDKFLVWRLKPGVLSYTARRTDGPASEMSETLDARSGYGESGFQPGGVSLPTAGCWDVTYRLNGADDLKFVLRAR